MAQRRWLHALGRRAMALFSIKTPQSLPLSTPILLRALAPNQRYSHISSALEPNWFNQWSHYRHFSLNKGDGEETAEESSDGEEIDEVVPDLGREYSLEEKDLEAADIGYKVVGPLKKSDRAFQRYEPVFAVVQIGSHQFKVSNGDSIFTERLKFCEVNDKLILNKVLMLGSQSQTIIGRPILPDAAVHAVVEEHALDAKVIIFKKKRRKNYRRTKGHRQELSKLRIVDIEGIEKPVKVAIAA